ncbi:MAG: Coq4 family protein [Gammaproteobacteria bacterium]
MQTSTQRRWRGPFHPANRIRPIVALRAVRALIRNPDSTGEVFKVIEALKGGSLQQAVDRMAASPEGRELLQRMPSIIERLSDRAALAAMPEGSLGRAYLAFVQAGNLSAEGLVEASEEPRQSLTKWFAPEEVWLADRLRDFHDLQHVMTGYGRDEIGELCLLSFMTTQTYNRGISFIVWVGRREYRRELPHLDVDALVREGRDIARAARWLPSVHWEERLAEPLESLRAELGLHPPAQYLAATRAA